MRGLVKGSRAGMVVLVLLCIGLLTVSLTGCGLSSSSNQEGDKKPPVADKLKITLYFSGSEGDMLIPEEREVEKKGEPEETIVVRELIKGPSQQGLFKTIPEGTSLLSLTVSDGIANVNFSKEIQTKHWGGSAGESMTVYSVVNSLDLVEGINKVQFLVEGNKVESLLGHIDTSKPLSPNKDLIKK